MVCPCCNQYVCCPGGDPTSMTVAFSGPLVFSSGNRFLNSIASGLLGTYVLPRTSEAPTGYSPGNWFATSSSAISSYPNTAAKIIAAANGSVYGYGPLSCIGGVPRAELTQLFKKTSANVVSGANTTVQFAVSENFGAVGVQGIDCSTPASSTSSFMNITGYSIVYDSGGNVVSFSSGAFNSTGTTSYSF